MRGAFDASENQPMQVTGETVLRKTTICTAPMRSANKLG
jgi:hypothetical protein